MRSLSLKEQVMVSGANDAIPITTAIASTTGAGIGGLIGTFLGGPVGAVIGSGIGAGIGTAIGIHAEDIGHEAAKIPSMVHVVPVYTKYTKEISVSSQGTTSMPMDQARKIWPGI